ALCRGPADGIAKHLATACGLQSILLQGERLLMGRNACIADQHWPDCLKSRSRSQDTRRRLWDGFRNTHLKAEVGNQTSGRSAVSQTVVSETLLLSFGALCTTARNFLQGETLDEGNNLFAHVTAALPLVNLNGIDSK